MPNNKPSNALRYCREALAQAPIDEDKKEFIEIFFEPAWFVEALAAFAVVHFGDLIHQQEFLRATEGMMVWVEDSEVFPPNLNLHIRNSFLGLIVATAAKIIRMQEVHPWN